MSQNRETALALNQQKRPGLFQNLTTSGGFTGGTYPGGTCPPGMGMKAHKLS